MVCEFSLNHIAKEKKWWREVWAVSTGLTELHLEELENMADRMVPWAESHQASFAFPFISKPRAFVTQVSVPCPHTCWTALGPASPPWSCLLTLGPFLNRIMGQSATWKPSSTGHLYLLFSSVSESEVNKSLSQLFLFKKFSSYLKTLWSTATNQPWFAHLKPFTWVRNSNSDLVIVIESRTYHQT